MTPSRILPDLQCSLLCEDVKQEINGNLFLIGVINLIRVPQLPIMAPKLCLLNRWTAGVGQFVETIRMIGPDQSTVLRKSENRFALQNATENISTITFMAQVKFETPGVYYVEVLVDDVMKLRFPLQLFVVPPEERPGAKPPQA
jgi:hypothetical protein